MTRLPFLFLAIICLGAGVLSGLVRAGVSLPLSLITHPELHSLFMISGFFGTVIGLERAVAIRKPWAYLAPLSSALGGLVLLTSAPANVAPLLFGLSGICFVAATVRVVLMQPAIYTATLLTGAVLWLLGNIGWLISGAPWVSIPYGLSFLVMTIAGERLELTRFLPPRPRATAAFKLIALFVLGGTLVSGITHFANNSLLGLSYALLAFWLIRYDIARKTIHTPGITRFVASCLLSGYAWLLIGGLLITGFLHLGVFQRDAAIHAIALGFIFAMVIGHAPIIFPAVVRLAIPFSPIFYAPLILTSLGALLRLLAALTAEPALRETGAIINAVGILSFMLCILRQVTRGIQQKNRRL